RLKARIGLVGLRYAGHDTAHVLHRPEHGAVRAAERPEVCEHTASPERGVASLVAGLVRSAGDPAAVVDAIADTRRAAESAQHGQLILRAIVRADTTCCETSDQCDEGFHTTFSMDTGE